VSIRALVARRVSLAVLLALTACEQKTADYAEGAASAASASNPATAPEQAAPAAAEPAPADESGAAATEPVGPSWTSIASNDGSYRVAYRTEPAEIPLNEPFTVHTAVFDAANGAPVEVTLDVDARMPAHRHGMVRAPAQVRNDDGTFTTTGMLFHMPGDWQLYFDVTRGGVTERAQTDIELD
jgi:hypothetical protein